MSTIDHGPTCSIRLNRIMECVGRWYGVTPKTILSAKRFRSMTTARQVVMYLARKLTDKSLEELGMIMNKDHSTVIHACQRVEALIETDEEFKTTISILRKDCEQAFEASFARTESGNASSIQAA